MTPAAVVARLGGGQEFPGREGDLAGHGFSADQVEAMSASEVVARYTLRSYDELRDGVFKWFGVPYYDAGRGALEADRKLNEWAREGREIIPIASLLVPTVYNARKAVVRTDRADCRPRVAEALRMHAAASDGRLPARLDEVAVPIPDDPGDRQAVRVRATRRRSNALRSAAPRPPIRWEIRMER